MAITAFRAKVIKGVFSASVFSMVSKVLAFILSLLLFRALTLTEYGGYQLAIATWGILTTFLFQGLFQFVLGRSARSLGGGDPIGSRTLIAGLFLFQTITSAALFLFIQICCQSHLLFDPAVRPLLWSFSFTLFAFPFGNCIRIFLSHEQKFVWMNLLTVAEDLFKMILILISLFILKERSAQVIINSITISSLVLTGVGTFYVRHQFLEIAPQFSLGALKEVIALIRHEGIWVILQKQVRQLGQNMRIFLVEFLFGKEGVALYGFGEKIVTQVMALLPLDDVLIPMLSHEHKNEKRVRQVFHTGFKYSFWFFSTCALLLAVFIPWIVRFLFPSYGLSIPVLRTMVLCLPVSGLATLLSVLFISHYKQKTLFFFVLIRWVWFFPVAYLLASLFGLKGIGLEYALALLAFTAMRYYALTRLHPWLSISWRELFQFTPADRAFMQSIAGAVVAKWKKKVSTTPVHSSPE